MVSLDTDESTGEVITPSLIPWSGPGPSGPRPLQRQLFKAVQLRLSDLSVVERLTGLRDVIVVPEPQRLQLFLFRPHLVQCVSFKQFTVLQHPVNRIGVV